MTALSAYALTRFGQLYRAQVIVTGVAALALTFALVAGEVGSGTGTVGLALFAVSRLLIARYPRGTNRLSRDPL